MDKGGVLHFDNVRLQEQDGVSDRGIIAVGGSIDIKRKLLDVEAAAVKANPPGDCNCSHEESAGNQRVKRICWCRCMAALTILREQLSWKYQRFCCRRSLDELTAMLALADDNIKLQQLIASKDAYGVSAAGDIPLDLFRDKKQRRNPDAQMNIVMDLDKARLGILPALY